jgi:hypothetical protein
VISRPLVQITKPLASDRYSFKLFKPPGTR